VYCGKVLERRGPLAVIEEIEAGDLHPVGSGGCVAIPHRHKTLGFVVRQRRKQDAIDHAEHGDIGADPER
jgi:hypothetical protein